MAQNYQEYVTKVFLNDEEAKNKLENLNRRIQTLRQEKEKALQDNDSKAFTKAERQIRACEKEMKMLSTTAQNVNRVLANLETASANDLRNTIKAINKELSSGRVERGTEAWKALNEQLRRAKTELATIEAESKAMDNKGVFGRFLDMLNKNWGAFTQIIGAITGLSMTIRQCVKAFAEMQEKLADVRKYTGLTTGEVELLNEELKKMDTRTSREQLNELAGAAGRLGVTARKDILEFVEAADTIGIALGDDLGDGAVDQIGKLAMAFGEDDRLGLRGAMLATGSAINELAQNSAAKAGYLVEFAARVAGVGKQVGLTQAQIFGLAAALDEGMLKEEMSATAISQLFIKMQTDTKTFAKIAGVEVKKFSDLVKNDFNAALTTLFTKLGQTDGMQKLSPMFEDMGLDGTRCVQVLTKLSDKIDDVTRHQQTATEAYREGNSVLNEAAIMNDTVMARLEKAKKAFNETAVTLGAQLEPVAKYTISTFSLLTKTLSKLMTFITEHIGTVTTLTASIVAYTIAVNAMTIAQKIINAFIIAGGVVMKTYNGTILLCRVAYYALTGSIEKATIAMRAFNIVTKLNPIGALATVITIAIGALLTITKRTNQSTSAWEKHKEEVKRVKDAQEHLNKITKDAAIAAKEEKTRLEQLTRVLNNNKLAYETRLTALNEIKKIVPSYHAQLTKEGELINNNNEALKEYADNLILQATIKAYADDIAELNKQIDELQNKNEKIRGSISAVEKEKKRLKDSGKDTDINPYTGDLMNSHAMSLQNKAEEIHSQRLAENEKAIADAMAKRKLIQDSLDKSIEKNKDAVKALTDNTAGGDFKSEKQQKKEETQRKKQEAEEKKRTAAALKAKKEEEKKIKAETTAAIIELNDLYASGNKTYREYIEEMYAIDKEGLRKRKEVWEEGSNERISIEEAEQKVTQEYEERKKKLNLETLQRQYQSRKAIIKAQYEDQNSNIYKNEEELNEALFCNEMDYLLQKQELYKKGTQEWYDLEAQITEKEEQNILDKRTRYSLKLQEYREEWGTIDAEKQKEIALQGLDSLHKEELLSEEEYQQMRLAIIAEYATMGAKAESETKNKTTNDILNIANAAVDNKTKRVGDSNLEDAGIGGNFARISNTISQYKTMYESITQMQADNLISEEQAAEAKKQLWNETMSSIASTAKAAYDNINIIVNAASTYAKACSDYEVAKISSNYDKQIESAGKNSKKREKLEKERDKKIQEAKTAASKRAMKMELAQAFASTALSAINAYSSAAEVPMIGYILAPAAAAAAIAAGMLQIAAIKKQHQTEQMGYYDGGFTGGRKYRREAGVVHEGEFVANHMAVNNPAIRPTLELIDKAQRNNTVARLTAEDVRLAAGGGTQVVAPVVNVTTDNEQLNESVANLNSAIIVLNERLNNGIEAYAVIDGENGVDAKLKKYHRLIGNK